MDLSTKRSGRTSSSVGNRIESNSQGVIQQYEMAHIVYDGTIGKWGIMEHHVGDGIAVDD